MCFSKSFSVIRYLHQSVQVLEAVALFYPLICTDASANAKIRNIIKDLTLKHDIFSAWERKWYLCLLTYDRHATQSKIIWKSVTLGTNMELSCSWKNGSKPRSAMTGILEFTFPLYLSTSKKEMHFYLDCRTSSLSNHGLVLVFFNLWHTSYLSLHYKYLKSLKFLKVVDPPKST